MSSESVQDCFRDLDLLLDADSFFELADNLYRD